MTRPRKPKPAAPPPEPFFPKSFEEMADAYARAAILLRELEKEGERLRKKRAPKNS